MSPILRRLLSHNINRSRFPSPRKFCTAADAVNRELLEPSSPWLMLSPSFLGKGDHVTYNLYSPTKCKVVSFNNRGGKQETDLMRDEHTRLVGSSHGWLALHNSRTYDFILSNPLSGRRVNLPPHRGKPEEECIFHTSKVIISCSPDNDDCRALMLLGGGKAALCRPGRSTEWAPLGRWYDNFLLTDEDFDDFRVYKDFVYSAALKKFLGFSLCGRSLRPELEGWDIADPVWPRTVRLDRRAMREPGSSGTSCLVSGEQPNQLFLVRRSLCDTDIKVYRIKVCGELELCSSLDDLVMFVGINHSFAVKASQFSQLKPNSIYFSELYGQSRSIGIFDYQNKTCSPVYYPSVHQKDSTPQPWFTPTLD